VGKLFFVGAFLTCLFGIGFCDSGESRAASACPAGKITCQEWCRRYRPDPGGNCMTGHPNSCDKKVGGARACVGDRPPS
jgi:hypothetical protein